MKKKILLLLSTCVLLIILFTVSASAERSTLLPTTMLQGSSGLSYDGAFLTEFEIYPGTLTGAPENKHSVTLSLKFYYYDRFYNADDYSLYCYDAFGNYLDTVNIGYLSRNTASYWKDSYVKELSIPEATASVELFSKNCANTYFYNPYSNVYGPDGTAYGVPTLLIPLYEAQGCKREVEVFTLDLTSTIKISPYQVDYYRTLGYYQLDEWAYLNAINYKNEYLAVSNYNAATGCLLAYTEYMPNGQFAPQINQEILTLMDKWRAKIKSPLAVLSYKVGEEYSTPYATIYFKNISYKKIIAYKIKFDCYNIFGEYERTYYSTYFDDDANIPMLGEYYATWDLYGADSVHTVKNIRVVEVVFEDGTKWKS